MSVFLTILTMLTFSWIINEVYVNILIFVYGWTHNAPRIPKIYNIIGIWWTDQKLLTVRPIATLRQVMKWKNDRRGDERYMTKVIYQQEALRRLTHMTSWLTDWLTNQLLKILSFPDWLTDQLMKILSLSWILIEVCAWPHYATKGAKNV